jgi:hypothetical protein
MTRLTDRKGVACRLAVLIAIAGAGAGAGAQSVEVEKRWYGWQTLLVDASAFGAGFLVYGAGGGQNSDVVRGTATTGVIYALGGPVVHFAHRNPGRAAGSFALRLVLPVLGALVGAAVTTCDHKGFEMFCGLDQAADGFLVGMVTAAVVDVAALSWAEVSPRPAPPPVALEGPEAQFVVDARHRTVGFAGCF